MVVKSNSILRQEFEHLQRLTGMLSLTKIRDYFITLEEFEDIDPDKLLNNIKSHISPKRFDIQKVEFYVQILKANHPALNKEALILDYEFQFSEFDNPRKMKEKEQEIMNLILNKMDKLG